MMRLPAVLGCVVLTFVCWGSYGPVLHIGQELMDHSRWRPFVCVGLAYFLIAVVVPMAVLQSTKEAGNWTLLGTLWSFFAGAIGAIGALGIILAFEFGGKPVYVMPVVFGGAPVVNTFVTMWMQRTQGQAAVRFYIAVLLVAIGAAGVFLFRPRTSPPPAPMTAAASEEGASSVSEGNDTQQVDDDKTHATPEPSSSFFKAALAVLMTAACWGSYGPFLHKGQATMGGSRLRPFICVGMAYFLVAVLVPSVYFLPRDPTSFTITGTFYSLLAGSVGAIGALGIILAFNFGGRPVFVMPLVFGGAPVINTIISMSQSWARSGAFGDISPLFLASLVMVIVGAVCVLLFAPRPSHAAPPQDDGAKPPADISPPPSPSTTPPTVAEKKEAGASPHSSSENTAKGADQPDLSNGSDASNGGEPGNGADPAEESASDSSSAATPGDPPPTP